MKFKFGFLPVFALLVASTNAQTVFVNSAGGTGKHTSLNAAIQAVTDDTAAPDEIVIEDEGPFFETRVIINESKTQAPLLIRAVPGVRPIIAIETSAEGALYIRKAGGPLTVRDLIIIPQLGDPLTRATAAVEGDNVTGSDTSVTLQNILVTSNDGNNRPLASLDGLTSPTWNPNVRTWRDEGILLSSSGTTFRRNYYLYDCVVSGISGDDGSDGIRIFTDGAIGSGSEVVVGPGCVVSYNDTMADQTVTSGTNSHRGGIQPGATLNTAVKVIGTQDNPVKVFNNNYNGIAETSDTNFAGAGLNEIKWCIIANNDGTGMIFTDYYANKDIANVTIANNSDGSVDGIENDLADMDISFSNVIFGGNGNQTDPNNIVDLTFDAQPLGTPSITVADSALPLSGPVSLNNVDYGADGVATNFATTLTNITNADPQFVSLDPTSSEFAVVGNAAYGTAGPGGQPLVGGGKFLTSSVSDWQLF